MDRGAAKAKLREIIARETKDAAPAPVNVTLRWFYENRFLPQKERQWKVTSRPKTKRFIENYLLKRFGDTPPRSRQVHVTNVPQRNGAAILEERSV